MVFSSIQEAIGFEIQLRDIPNGRPKIRGCQSRRDFM